MKAVERQIQETGQVGGSNEYPPVEGCNCGRRGAKELFRRPCPFHAVPEPVETEGAAKGFRAWVLDAHKYGVRFLDCGETWVDDGGSGPVARNIALALGVAAPIAPAAVSEPVWIDCPMCGTRFADATGTAHDLSLRKPSAEGDGWIAPKTMPGECELVQILLTDNRVTAGHYTETPKLGVEWWADGGLLETQDIQAWKPMSPPPPQWLPAPPSGQGEKR